jgi:hypothetical protein
VVPKAKPRIFIVPFFLDGTIRRLNAYSRVVAAQRALRAWVGYDDLVTVTRRKNPTLSEDRVMLSTYGAINQTRYRGTAVYEVVVDDPTPNRVDLDWEEARKQAPKISKPAARR